MPPAEQQEQPSSFIAAVDITTENEGFRYLGKIEEIKQLIKTKGLGKFAYYRSPRDGRIISPKSGVPHIMIALPPDQVQEFIALTQLQKEQGVSDEMVSYWREMLKNHPFKNEVRAQIYEFLARSRRYAFQLREQFKESGAQKEVKQQNTNMQILRLVLERLQSMQYPRKVQTPALHEQLTKAFY